jgi:UDP-N-acetyl-D-glucosamine dehydrogenase
MKVSLMSEVSRLLLEKLKNKQATVGILGLGYVGQPLMLRYSDLGFKVIGFDVDAEKVDLLNQGKSRIAHIDDQRIKNAVSNGFTATTNFSQIVKCDALILCVPTPLNRYREPDMSYVVDTTDMMKPFLREGQVVSLESTTYPGTTEELLKPRLEERGLVVGEDIFLVYSPEREDPGNPNFETRTIPKVVGGYTEKCKEIGLALYEQAIDKLVPVSSTKAAELTKLLENIHRAVNIGLVNEMKVVADKMGIDIFEVIKAAATKPFGFTAYYPGPGLGGHCIPIDPYYLTWKAKEFGLSTRFIELSGEVNRAMPEFVIGKLMDALNTKGKALSKCNILILGIAYKKNVDDMRESPSVEIMDLIRKKGANVDYSDPFVPSFGPLKEYDYKLESQVLNKEMLAGYDAVVLTTDHSSFDYDLILDASKLIVDTRGRFNDRSGKVVKA